MTTHYPIPPNNGGVREQSNQALPYNPESRQDCGMQDRAWKVVERACVVSGALCGVIAAAYTVAGYYAPRSADVATPSAVGTRAPAAHAALASGMIPNWAVIFLAVFGVALLATGWAMILRRGATGQIIKPSAEGSPGPSPLQAPSESPDVLDAKLQLENFVLRHLNPTIAAERETLRMAANVIKFWDYRSPQAEFAWTGVNTHQPKCEELSVFNLAETTKAAPMRTLERAIQLAIGQYSEAASQISSIIALTDPEPQAQRRVEFVTAFSKWMELHRELQARTKAMVANVHYPQLRAFLEDSTFLPPSTEMRLEWFDSSTRS